MLKRPLRLARGGRFRIRMPAGEGVGPPLCPDACRLERGSRPRARPCIRAPAGWSVGPVPFRLRTVARPAGSFRRRRQARARSAAMSASVSSRSIVRPTGGTLSSTTFESR